MPSVKRTQRKLRKISLKYGFTSHRIIPGKLIVIDDIEEKCDALANNPLMGRLRAEIAPELRYFAVGKYLILSRAVQDGIEVVRVIHGARDWLHLF